MRPYLGTEQGQQLPQPEERNRMGSFTKRIEQLDSGTAFASVHDSDGNRVGYRFFSWPPFSQEKRLKRAHAWADRWLANCEKYATPKGGQK